jgi:hypothetical protein
MHTANVIRSGAPGHPHDKADVRITPVVETEVRDGGNDRDHRRDGSHQTPVKGGLHERCGLGCIS